MNKSRSSAAAPEEFEFVLVVLEACSRRDRTSLTFRSVSIDDDGDAVVPSFSAVPHPSSSSSSWEKSFVAVVVLYVVPTVFIPLHFVDVALVVLIGTNASVILVVVHPKDSSKS